MLLASAFVNPGDLREASGRASVLGVVKEFLDKMAVKKTPDHTQQRLPVRLDALEKLTAYTVRGLDSPKEMAP